MREMIRDRLEQARCYHCGRFDPRWLVGTLRVDLLFWGWHRCINCGRVDRVLGVDIRPNCSAWSCTEDGIPF